MGLSRFTRDREFGKDGGKDGVSGGGCIGFDKSKIPCGVWVETSVEDGGMVTGESETSGSMSRVGNCVFEVEEVMGFDAGVAVVSL